MMLEISPQYHGLILGDQQLNIKSIMQQSGARIMFPDPIDPYTPSLKKSSVTIIGNIKHVYKARQMLLVSKDSIRNKSLAFSKCEILSSYVDYRVLCLWC